MKPLASIEITDAALNDLLFGTLSRISERLEAETAPLAEALREVVENVVEHAYEDPDRFLLKARFSADDTTIRIDVTDTGLPFDFGRYRSESLSIPPDHSKGFYRIYDLIDRFYVSNVAGVGKCFTLIHSIESAGNRTETVVPLPVPVPSPSVPVSVRPFQNDDAEGIARLIYRNYDYSYYKTLYYEAEAIRDANARGAILSVVATAEAEVIGHFAIIPSEDSEIGEIAAAAVDPRFKRMGIMNQMFDRIVSMARQKGLLAVYGEGIMLHPYSQKANLRHGMVESAILLGEVPASMEIEHRIKTAKRSAVLIASLLFDPRPRALFLPARYRGILETTYRNGSVPLLPPETPPLPHSPGISYRINPLLKTATITIETCVAPGEIDSVLRELMPQRCDVWFADINLHRIDAMDAVVASLNERLFFYGGVMFCHYHNEDYLRLQRKMTADIEEEQLICYSPFALELLTFILRDEAALSLK